MPRFSRRDSDALKEARAYLLRDEGRSESPVNAVLATLSTRFDAAMCLYNIGVEEGRFAIDRWAAVGSRRLIPDHRRRDLWDRAMRTAKHRFGFYDPLRPDPRQRNVAMVIPSFRQALETDLKLPISRRTFDDAFATAVRAAATYDGTLDAVQLRTLICDGGVLLAWVGALRDEPFSVQERRFLGALIPAMRSRLRFEAALGSTNLHAAAAAAALEEIPSAAAIVGANGRLVVANAVAREQFDQDRFAFAAQLRAALEGRLSSFRLTSLEARGEPGYWLAISTARPPDTDSAVHRARQRFGLTARQSQVLSLLARGCSTRVVAAELGCSERTVGAHITAILERLNVSTRAQAVARLWT